MAAPIRDSGSLADELRDLAATPDIEREVAAKLRDAADAADQLAGSLREMVAFLDGAAAKLPR